MARTPVIYVATHTFALPTHGVAYLATAQVGSGQSHRRHQHAEVQVLWMLAGAVGMAFEDDDDSIALSVGTCCVVPPNVSHRVRPVGRSPRVAQLIDLRIIDDPANPFRQFLESLGSARRFDTSTKAVELATHRLQTAAAQRGLARQAGLLSAIWELLGTLAPNSFDRPTNATELSNVTRDPRIDAAEAFCRHQLSSPLTVDDVAAAVGLSRSQLSRLFYATYQIGPAERLRQLRIELARHLLSTTTLSVKEVAHACGFVRANHFGRVFQQVTGTTPFTFRNRASQ